MHQYPRRFKSFFLLSIPAVFLFCQSAQANISGKASWYSTECCKFNPDKDCPMANGQSLYVAERAGEDFAASWLFPLGSRVKVTNPKTGKSVIVKIADRGPAKRLGRVIDLSKKSFLQIANPQTGILNVTLEVMERT